jgi:hypothetical protein
VDVTQRDASDRESGGAIALRLIVSLPIVLLILRAVIGL